VGYCRRGCYGITTVNTYWKLIVVFLVQKEICFSVVAGSQISFASPTDLTLPVWSAPLQASERQSEMRSGMCRGELYKRQLC